MASPVVSSKKPAGLIDPRQTGDYPIILGDSLKSDAKSKDSFLNLRYNWQPKSGFVDGRNSKLRQSGDRWQLEVPNDDSGIYQYTGASQRDQSLASSHGSKSFVLIFDEARSAFVLEAVSATVDLNLRAGPGMPRDVARNLPQLKKESSGKKDADNTSSDDEIPDDSSPYDFRRFLGEAREAAEKQAQTVGNRTPVPGSRTPLAAGSTPIPGGSRFMPTTPQFKATQSRPTAKAAEPRKKTAEPATRPTKAPAKSLAKRDTPNKTSQPLSKATISDSDDSDEETINVARAQVAKPTTAKPPKPAISRGHARNISANIGSSPHIIINDDDGDLEIDMGSPPPEAGSHKRGRVDPGAFRSHTGTPVGGLSSNLGGAASRPISRPPPEQNTSHGRRERDGDVRMRDIEAASEDDDDDDVEEFDLGSPREKSSPPRRGTVTREDDSDEDEPDRGRRPQHDQIEHVPTPPAPTNTYEDDDEDLLEAALEAALEEESENQHSGVGLGIGMSNGHIQDDDESEVSEEE
jgi:hypothetical protein